MDETLQSFGTIYDIVSSKPTIGLDGGITPALNADIKPSIVFDSVFFRYPGADSTDTALDDVSFTVEPGQTAAFVGVHGSGKRTVVRLLTRFYDVLGGVIRVGGHDTRNLNPSWLRQQVSIINYRPKLLRSSLKDNLTYGCLSEPSQEEFDHACKIAGLQNLMAFKGAELRHFPCGRHQIITHVVADWLDRHGYLPRIAVARALLRQAPIVVLDDVGEFIKAPANASLFAALTRDKTVVMVSNLLHHVTHADLIFVMDNGRCAASGTHENLLSCDPFYQQMYHMELMEQSLGSDDSFGQLAGLAGSGDTDFDADSQSPKEDESSASHNRRRSQQKTAGQRLPSSQGRLQRGLPSGDSVMPATTTDHDSEASAECVADAAKNKIEFPCPVSKPSLKLPIGGSNNTRLAQTLREKTERTAKTDRSAHFADEEVEIEKDDSVGGSPGAGGPEAGAGLDSPRITVQKCETLEQDDDKTPASRSSKVLGEKSGKSAKSDRMPTRSEKIRPEHSSKSERGFRKGNSLRELSRAGNRSTPNSSARGSIPTPLDLNAGPSTDFRQAPMSPDTQAQVEAAGPDVHRLLRRQQNIIWRLWASSRSGAGAMDVGSPPRLGLGKNTIAKSPKSRESIATIPTSKTTVRPNQLGERTSVSFGPVINQGGAGKPNYNRSRTTSVLNKTQFESAPGLSGFGALAQIDERGHMNVGAVAQQRGLTLDHDLFRRKINKPLTTDDPDFELLGLDDDVDWTQSKLGDVTRVEHNRTKDFYTKSRTLGNLGVSEGHSEFLSGAGIDLRTVYSCLFLKRFLDAIQSS